MREPVLEDPEPAAPWLAYDALRPLGGVAHSWGYLVAGGESDQPRVKAAATGDEVARTVRAGNPGGPWFAFAPGDTHIRTIYEFDDLADAVAERGAADARRAFRRAVPKALFVLALLVAGLVFWPSDREVQMGLLLVAILFVVPLWRQGVEAAFDAWRDQRRIERDPDGWRRKQNRHMRFGAYAQSNSSWAAYGLVGAFVVVFVASIAAGKEEAFARWGLWKPAVRDGETWRLLTCAFLHVNVIHLLFNSMAGLSLAGMARSIVNETRILLAFLLSAVAGSAASCALSDAPSIGASGGILGWGGLLTGMALVHPELRSTGLISMMLRWVVVLSLIGFAGMGLIDNAAHGGGFAAGLLFGAVVARVEGPRLPIGPARPTPALFVLAAATAAVALYLVVDLVPVGGR